MDRRLQSRIENLVSWFAASLMVTAGIIYSMRLDAVRARRPAPRVSNPRPGQEPLGLQRSRANEPGRGRKAATPAHIPWLGWKDILIRGFYSILNDRLLALAAGVVFYSLVSLFPAIAAGVSSYALFADASTISKHLLLVADIVPANVLDVLRDEITRIADKSDGGLTFGFIVGFGIA